MQSPFEIVVRKLIELGFYDYLFPFIITTTIFYALLKKSKLIGESVVVNATLATSIAFLIFGFPVLAGITLSTPFATFFTQVTIWILVFAVGILIASLFYPNIQVFLTKYFIERMSRTIWGLIALGLMLFIISGLLWVMIGPVFVPRPGVIALPLDLLVSISGIIIFAIIIFIAAWMVRGV